MSFTTYIPCRILTPFVKSIAISFDETASSYKIFPGTSIVMGFQFSGRLSYSNNSKTIPLNTSGITGLMNTYRLFNNSANTGSVLVMFSETGASAFFKNPMHELFNQSLALDDLMLRSRMDVVTEQLNEADSDKERINVIEDFLISRLNNKIPDELVNLSVSLIKQSKGNIKITTLTEKLNISQSQFEKRFRKIVGTSPKKFASIVRFRAIFHATPITNDLTALALDSGYFDQAHFIKDFKSFTGQTPEQYFKGK
jgi:AraC-like DNA-binding protein